MNLPGPKRGRDAEPRLPIVLVLLPAFFLLGSLFAVPLRERAPRGLRLAGTRVDAPPAPGAGTPLLSPSGRGAPSDPTTARRSAPGALAIARSLAAPPEPAPPDDPSDPRGWVLIHLLEAGTGAPAAGAEVELTLFPRDLGFDEPPSTLLRRADEDGTVRVPLEEGEVRVVAWQGPLVGGPLGTSISARTESLVELELVRGFEVSGLVRDAATGLPVAGAEVRFWTFSESDAVATADDGTFRHPRFPASEFAEQVQVRAPGYGATVRYLQVLADGSYRIPDPLVEGGAIRGTGTPWIEVSLVPEQRIRGTVVDAGGRPVAGATVHAEGYYHTLPDIASLDAATATTDTTGAFELAGLRSDISHGVAVRAAGFAEAYREVAPGEQETRLQPLVLDREVTIAGVVVDAEGYPVQDIRVLLRRTAQDATEADSLDRMEGLLDVSFRTWDDEFEVRTRPDGTFL
ncbi:MAG TPA: carboxypeptidase regulatory-like domain-containing protein, partial [Planctomycetes bacterium]|nr:carboxypeptidase regulatory-like domain-containing protein [Planctomycetota bacterium]